jgi:nitrite reductase/ring-hydroxylating ferredoxin subunit
MFRILDAATYQRRCPDVATPRDVSEERRAMKVGLCKVAEIPEEGTTTVNFFGREVLVFKVDGRPTAVLNVCMHLGGPMSIQGGRLVCAWHGAAFATRDGHCLQGPAPSDSRLIRLPTRVEDGVLTYVYGE